MDNNNLKTCLIDEYFTWENILAILESIPYPLILRTHEGDIFMTNKAMRFSMYLSDEDTMALNIKTLYSDIEDYYLVEKLLQEQGAVKNFETTFVRKNGEKFETVLDINKIQIGSCEFLMTSMLRKEEMQKMYDKLNDKNQEIASFYQISGDALMRLEPPEWKFIEANPKTVELFGFGSEKEFFKFGPADLSPLYQPDGSLSSEKALKMIDKAMDEGSTSFEWTHKKKNGDEFFTLVFLNRIEKNGKKLLQAIVKDISEAKNETKELQKFVRDTKNKLVDIIPNLDEIQTPLEGKGLSETQYILSVLDNMINAIKERHMNSERSRKALFSLAEDISFEKNKLEVSKKETEAIINSIGDGVFVTDKFQFITLFNPAAEKLSGWKAEEVKGKIASDVLHFYESDEINKPSAFIEDLFATGEARSLGLGALLKKKNGNTMPIIDSISPLRDSSGTMNGCVVVFSDATKEHEIDKAKGEFVSLASHQLRTPISTVSWFVEMLLTGEMGEMSEKQKEYLEEVNILNKRMKGIVSRLLNVSRIEMGTFAVEPEIVKIGDIVDSVIFSRKPLLKKKNIAFESIIDDNSREINADRDLLDIVIDNLLSNAINYTGLDGKITLRVSKNVKEFIIEVSDTGIGIPEESHTKVFTKMFRANNAKEVDTTGTGIGLYMIQAIITNWGGTIRFTSPIMTKKADDGRGIHFGTTFYVTLPLSGMKKKEGSSHLLTEF